MEMILKSSSNDFFNLTLKLEVNSDLTYINVHVILLNKVNNKKQMRLFDPNKLSDALDFYWQQESMFIKA